MVGARSSSPLPHPHPCQRDPAVRVDRRPPRHAALLPADRRAEQDPHAAHPACCARRIAGRPVLRDRNALPTPVRLLILALAIRWALSALPLTLLVRQFWSNLASLLVIAGIVWLLILLNGEVEQYRPTAAPALELSGGDGPRAAASQNGRTCW